MSLRTRLLIAIGVIAVVALAVADVVTYSALRVVPLSTGRPAARPAATASTSTTGRTAAVRPLVAMPGPGGPSGTDPRRRRWSRASGPGGEAPVTLPDLGRAGAHVGPARSIGAPELPGLRRRHGLHPRAARPPSPAFQPRRRRTGAPTSTPRPPRSSGPAFRVRASILDDGDVLIVAQPLGDIGSTLHHLLLVELAVTGGAVLIALHGRLLAGPHRAAPAARHGGDGRVHRRRQPHRAGAGGERHDRGRAPGPHPQRHAVPDRVRLRRPGGLRGAPAGLRSTGSGASWPTPPTSCAPPSPPSPPTPSCSGGEPPSRRRTSNG